MTIGSTSRVVRAQRAIPLEELSGEDVAPWLEHAETSLGPVRRVGAAAGIEGIIEGIDPRRDRPAGSLGSDAAAWSGG